MAKKRKKTKWDLWDDMLYDDAVRTVNNMFKAHKKGKPPHGSTFTNLGLKRKKRKR